MQKSHQLFREHYYGPQIHILNSPHCEGVLADLCSPKTHQPLINDKVRYLYQYLLDVVLDHEFPHIQFKTETRMTAQHPGIGLHGTRIDPEQRVTVIDVARAGIIPSQTLFDRLHFHINAPQVRLDHIFASRQVNTAHKVMGTQLGAAKIGGDIKDSILLLPDPMGATGETVVTVLTHYKESIPGPAKKWILMHLIVTPEYLSRVTKALPDAIIYALRLDRGLSPPEVLESKLGEQWDLERGLNEIDYIIPGAGGLGEVINNSFV